MYIQVQLTESTVVETKLSLMGEKGVIVETRAHEAIHGRLEHGALEEANQCNYELDKVLVIEKQQKASLQERLTEDPLPLRLTN